MASLCRDTACSSLASATTARSLPTVCPSAPPPIPAPPAPHLLTPHLICSPPTPIPLPPPIFHLVPLTAGVRTRPRRTPDTRLGARSRSPSPTDRRRSRSPAPFSAPTFHVGHSQRADEGRAAPLTFFHPEAASPSPPRPLTSPSHSVHDRLAHQPTLSSALHKNHLPGRSPRPYIPNTPPQPYSPGYACLRG